MKPLVCTKTQKPTLCGVGDVVSISTTFSPSYRLFYADNYWNRIIHLRWLARGRVSLLLAPRTCGRHNADNVEPSLAIRRLSILHLLFHGVAAWIRTLYFGRSRRLELRLHQQRFIYVPANDERHQSASLVG